MNIVSTVPDVIDALVDRLRIKATGTEIVVTDGQPVGDEGAASDLVSIGYTGEVGEIAVQDARTREQAAASPDRERYDIFNVASSWPGTEDTTQKTARRRAYDLLNWVAEIVATDQTLGGACGRAVVTSTATGQEQTNRGAVCSVAFTVHVDAYTRRM